MSLFDRNPNEENFVGGKKHWTDVIKNSGPKEFIFRQYNRCKGEKKWFVLILDVKIKMKLGFVSTAAII